MRFTESQFASLHFYRNTTVYLHCDQSRTTPIATADGEIVMLNYVSYKCCIKYTLFVLWLCDLSANTHRYSTSTLVLFVLEAVVWALWLS